MLSLLLRVVDQFRPREGWILFLLYLAALLCVPAAIYASKEDLGSGGLFALTFLAAIVSLRLARSRLRARTVAILSGLLGVGLVIVIVGRLLPPLPVLWNEVRSAIDWVGHWRRGLVAEPLPFASTAAYVWQRLTDLGIRFSWWVQRAVAGADAQDSTVVMLFTAVLVWAVGCFASWQIYRRQAILAGLLPSGVVIATVSFFAGGLSLFYLFVYLCCTLSLVAIWHLRSLQDRWRRTNTDYPGDMELELSFSLGLILLITLGLGAIFPVVGPRQIGAAFWRVMERPWASLEHASERLFGPIDYRGGLTGGGRPGTLPQAHMLRGAPDLAETVVLFVTTNDPAPPRLPDDDQIGAPEGQLSVRRYWRAATYDTYTGLGWINGPLDVQVSPPNQPLQPGMEAGVELLQHYEVLGSGEGVVYAVNAPVRVDRTIQASWRGPGDLAQMTGAAREYVAVSHPPEPTIAQLRDASPLVPPDLAERYLALPETLPQEVRDLADQVAGGRATRYDQAKAIETYLRAYPYTLDLPDPPADRDLVDYFLFYLQKGYCDYYASAMVVMARAVGIPARIATGYAQGTYDYDLGRWVVTKEDGHTWVEIYFEGIGWVEFEPTAGLPALSRPGGEEAAGLIVPPLPPRSLLWWQRVPWALVGLCLVLALVATIVFWLWHPARQQGLTPSDLIRDRYGRLLRWGARLGQPLHDGQTVSEYATSLVQTLRTRGQNSRLGQVRQSSQKAPAEVRQLAETFVRAQYSAGPVTGGEGWHIRSLWLRLRRRLWWLWVARR